MAGVEQSTVVSAGLDPFASRLAALDKRRDDLSAREQEYQGQQAGAAKETERLIAERGAAVKEPREKLIAKMGEAPKGRPAEEPIPSFERPTMKPDDLKESMGLMLAASLMTGLASRAPYYNAMNAISAGMTGFMKQDEKVTKEAFVTFDKNIKAIQDRNAQKRRAFEDAWREYSNDLEGLRRQLELVAAQYDDPIALQAARSKSITEAQKILENSIKATDTATERLVRDKVNMENAQARQEEARARREDASARHQEMMDFRREQAARAQQARDEKLGSTRFKDTQSLRKEYQADTKGVRSDLEKVDRILKIAEQPGGFSDVQLRQAITDFQKGSRGTNAMINSMMNFGSLDERIAGTVTRFLEGQYTPEQRADVKNLFTMIKNDILAPGLNERKAHYRALATKNRLDPDEATNDVEFAPLRASDNGSIGVDPGMGRPAPAALPTVPSAEGVAGYPGFLITPRGGAQ